MRKSIVQKYTGGGFERFLGLKIERLAEGEAQVRLMVRKDFLTGIEAVHGGITYSLLDHAMGGAVFSTLKEGMACVTIKLEIEYIKAIRQGEVIARTWVTKREKNTVWAKGEVLNDGQLAARGKGKFRTIRYASFVRLS